MRMLRPLAVLIAGLLAGAMVIGSAATAPFAVDSRILAAQPTAGPDPAETPDNPPDGPQDGPPANPEDGPADGPDAGVKLGEVPAWVGDVELAMSVREMLAIVRFLAGEALRGRGSFTPDERVAAEFVACEFERIGLEPAGDDGGYLQRFLRRGESSQNVIGKLPGTDPALAGEAIVIGAHVDHLGICVPRDEKWGTEAVIHPGADDNATGIAALLAIAKTLAGRGGIRRAVYVVGFGAEEDGLVGSRFFAARPPVPMDRISFMVNLDMIGHPVFLDKAQYAPLKPMVGIRPGRGVGTLGTAYSPKVKQICTALAQALELPIYAPEDFPALRAQIQRMLDGRSDATAFEQRRVPYVFFSTSEHDAYHSPADTMAMVDGETLRLVATLALRTVLAVDAASERPTFVRE